MILCELLNNYPMDDVFAQYEVESITESSVKATRGTVFVCISGARADGHCYAADAYARGCRIFVAERALSLPKDALVILVDSTRRVLSEMACRLHKDPSRQMHLIGITGTKGKTTTAHLLAHVLNQNGIPCGYIGTNGIKYGELHIPTRNTTPDALTLQQTLADMRHAGVMTAVIEVSSQALMQYRVAGMRFETVMFTNLSPDHVGENEHPDLAHYAACKHTLFTDFEATNLIYNADDPSAHSMIHDTCAKYVQSCSTQDWTADFYGTDIESTCTGSALGIRFILKHQGATTKCALPLLGKINAYNAMMALAVAKACFGISLKDGAESLVDVRIDGRSEMIPLPNQAFAIIDYAHNGESLRQILTSLREYKRGRLIAVFGSIGGRARLRREELGRAAAELCDLCILTSDNPAMEDPEQIMDDIASAFADFSTPYLKIADREAAIKYALQLAKQGDILLFAGKGHETYQLIGKEKRAFSEKAIILQEIEHMTTV